MPIRYNISQINLNGWAETGEYMVYESKSPTNIQDFACTETNVMRVRVYASFCFGL